MNDAPPGVRGRTFTSGAEVLRRGVFAGVIGYAVVALFFALASVLQGRSPFHIANVLGHDLFRGGAQPGMPIDAGAVLSYNGVHLIAFLVAGFALAWLAVAAGRAPQGWYFALIAILFVGAHVAALPIWFGQAVQVALPLWLVTVSSTLATAAMCIYLWKATPSVAGAAHEPDEQRVWRKR